MALKCPKWIVIISLLMIIVETLAVSIDSPVFYTIVSIMFWSIGFCFAVKSIKQRFALFGYYIGFMLFLLAGYSLNYLVVGNFSYLDASDAGIAHTCFSLSLTLLVMNCFAFYFHSKNEFIEADRLALTGNEIQHSNLVRIFLVALMIVSFICQLIVEFTITRYSLSTSYINSSEITSRLPSIIVNIASYYYISTFLYLSTMPDKRKTLLSIIALVLIEVVIIMSGERGEPLSIAFSVLFYLFIRYRANIRDIVIKKRYVVLLLILLPMLITFLQNLSSTRVNKVYEESSYGVVYDFTQSQGVSVKIIGRCYDRREQFTEIGGHTYVLGELRNYAKNNVFSRLLLGTKRLSRTEEALSGDKFSTTYNYLVGSSYSFNRGVGGGTTYIAEVYQDGGYIFLIIANILLASLIAKVDSFNDSKSIFKMAISMNILRYLVLIPRGYYLNWFTDTFAIQNLILFAFVKLLINYSENRYIINENDSRY